MKLSEEKGPEELALSCPQRGLWGLSFLRKPAGVMEWWSNGVMIRTHSS